MLKWLGKIWERAKRENYIGTLLGLALAAIVALGLLILKNDPISSITLAIVSGLTPVILDIFLQQRSLHRVLGEVSAVLEDPWLYTKVREIAEGYSRKRALGKNDPIVLKAQARIEDCARSMAELARGHTLIDSSHEEKEMLIRLIKLADTTACAVSHSSMGNEWWHEELGRQYLKANQDLIKSGTTITRIFIIADPHAEETINLMQEHHDHGVNVRYVTEAGKSPALVDQTYLIIDNKVASVSRFSVRGKTNGCRLTTDDFEIKTLKDNFEILLASSREYTPAKQADNKPADAANTNLPNETAPDK